jgi:hypothetical protein
VIRGARLLPLDPRVCTATSCCSAPGERRASKCDFPRTQPPVPFIAALA